ncbi:ATP-binding cassette domain-containing protein [Granulicoccus sp. GXG6511]|uniref:ATP-binding cassette domain-containing protein n=1 Tax=Granulicoccus sp. GXG6511 TaxID=3381351 RepID=UPI003D7D5557
MTGQAIRVEGLEKRYADTTALAGVDMEVATGTVLGLLGHNGAGKTTLVRTLATLIRPDAGRAMVAGHDVEREPGGVRQNIALAGQYAAVDELLTGRQNLQLIARLRHVSPTLSAARATALLEEFGLARAADRPVGTYSGGMRRRLDLAACLVTTPAVLFLDEPTTGLDPASRLDLWSYIRRLTDDGVTVLLTTQYLEEADMLADRIVVLKDGRRIAEGTPAELKAQVGNERVVVEMDRAEEFANLLAEVQGWPAVTVTVEQDRLRLTLEAPEPFQCLRAVADHMDRRRTSARHLALRSASLDEVFLELTGQPT